MDRRRASRAHDATGDTFVDRFADLHAVAYRAAYSVLGRPDDAADVAQEALARTLVRWHRVEVHAVPWVARVATNLAIDQARRRHPPLRRPVDVDTDADVERRRDLVRALTALPRRQREAVVLRHLVDLSEDEVARAMGCGVGTVKSSVSRGLERLRTELGPGHGAGGVHAPAWTEGTT